MDTAESPDNKPREEIEANSTDVEYAGLTQYWLNNTIAALAIGSMLLREKKQKSSIRIQRVYRGYKVRKKNNFTLQSIIRIQKTWRGFMGRRRYYQMLRDLVAWHVNAHYYRAARTIQAAFRGYYSRKYVHDQGKLKQLRLESACELLECVAIKARELLKNHQLPGVYSLRNSVCLSKVEKLMESLRLKRYNESVKEARAERVAKLRKAFEKSMRSKYETEIPFGNCMADTGP